MVEVAEVEVEVVRARYCASIDITIERFVDVGYSGGGQSYAGGGGYGGT